MNAWTPRWAQAVLGALILCAMPLAARATNARAMFLEHLSTLDGLPQGTVYATLQDTQGFVWFGTEDGLIRYDGHEIVRYAASPRTAHGLQGDFVFALAEDKHGDIWAATKGAGLARWNRATDTFTVYRHDNGSAQSIGSDLVRTLMVDSHDRIWIGTLDAGVDVFDPRSGRFDHLRQDLPGGRALVSNEIYALLEDRRGEVWVGTVAGVDRWSFDGERFARNPSLPGGTAILPGKKIEQFVDGGDGTVWIATFESGLFHVGYSGEIIANVRHDPARLDTLSSDEVHALLDDHAGHVWIGTAEGLDSLDRSTNRVDHYAHDKADASSLSDSFVMSLYEDSAGLLWIGTRGGGVDRWNSHSRELGGSRPVWLDGKSVTAFGDAADEHVWLGTLGAGLFDVDTRTGDAANLDAILHRDNVLGDRRVMSLHRDRRGDLWIGTLAAGLKKLSRDGQLTSIPTRAGDARSLSAAGIAVIYEAKNGLLWVGTHGGGANILDPGSGQIRQLPYSAGTEGAVSAANITAFAEDANGNMWIGTEGGGVDVAHADGTVFKIFRHDAEDSRGLSSNVVYALSVEAGGQVWIATDGGGLDQVLGSSMHPETIEFKSFSLAEGLSSDTIYGVVPDTFKHLWLSGNAGLMRFDLTTHAVKTFHREHGLQGEEYNSGAYLLTRDGRICFGGPDGYNIFDPSQLSAESSPPRIALTGIEVLGAPAHEAMPFWLLRAIPLDYGAKVVSFDFAALDFTSPTRNRLAYRVTGLTDNWIDLNSQHRVTLTNLEAGDHLLEVRAANADAVWSTQPFRLTIHKQAAPWQTKTAYAAYAILGIGLILWIARAQRYKLRRALIAKQRLESEVAARTRELREANQQLIVAGEVKNEFLSRMGHELRTPMNGVVGMAELLARSPLSTTQARQIQTIRSSARTLLQILNDLLDLSKAQAGKIEFESLPLDLTLLIEECIALFAGAAETKGLRLIACPPTDEPALFGDPLRLRQILMNLIGNAVKFTERGEIVVTCNLAPLTDHTTQVCLAVADTGVGIASTSLSKVFEPFSQADETTTRRFGGTGLGLSICQQLVHLMGGDISVMSKPESGSTFLVTLPLKTAAQAPAPGQRMFAGKTMLVMTRRLAFAESLRRYAHIDGAQSRICEPDSAIVIHPDEVVVIDADSYSQPLASMLSSPLKSRLVVLASTAAIAEQNLESLASPVRLLRGWPERDAVRNALLAVFAAPARGADSARVVQLVPQFSAHVLIVEDDSVNAAVAQGYLAELGCRCAWVTGGLEAVARTRVERFDMIFMDLNMPGLDGCESTKQIRMEEAPGVRVPIIALTASNAAVYREQCIAAGMDDILTKPYTLAECTATLRRWANGSAPARVPLVPGSFTPHELASLDPKVVTELRSVGDASQGGLFSRLVALFEKSAPHALLQIDAALRTGELAKAAGFSHKLKGAAANVGAVKFAAYASELEHSCTAAPEAARTLYDNLAAAWPTLLANLDSLILRASA